MLIKTKVIGGLSISLERSEYYHMILNSELQQCFGNKSQITVIMALSTEQHIVDQYSQICDNSPNHQANLPTEQHRSEAAPGWGVNLLSLPTLPSPGCPPLMSKHFLASPCISYFHFQSFQKWHFTMVVWRSLWPWAIMERYQTNI